MEHRAISIKGKVSRDGYCLKAYKVNRCRYFLYASWWFSSPWTSWTGSLSGDELISPIPLGNLLFLWWNTETSRLKQGCGSAFISFGSGSSIWGWTDPDPGLQWPKFKKNYSWKKTNFFLDQKLQFTYPYASIKNVQVTEEAFSSQKRPSNTSEHEL